MTTTAELSQVWAYRGGPAAARHYWDSAWMPHRDQVIRALEEVAPFESVLEVGCNAGPNLRRIALRWPRARLTGVDPNLAALLMATRQAELEGWLDRAWLLEGTTATVEALVPVQDVVLTCYCLAYTVPDDLPATLLRLRGLARCALILIEPTGDSEAMESPGQVPAWRHDYPAVIDALFPGSRCDGWDFDGPDALNHVTIVRCGAC